MSPIDSMYLKYLQHGGHNIDNYDWSQCKTKEARKKLHNKYRQWYYYNNRINKSSRTVDEKNILQFDLQSGKNNYRRAVIAIAKFEHAMRNVGRLVCKNCHTWCLVTNYKTDYVCNRCKTNKYNQSHFLNKITNQYGMMITMELDGMFQ